MRKNILLSVTILTTCFVLTSYSNKITVQENSIVGKWEFRDIAYDVKTSEDEATEKILSYFSEAKDLNQDLVLEFTADGKVISNLDEEVQTYIVSGDEITRSANDKDEKIKFAIEGDTLSLLLDLSEMLKDKTTRRMIRIHEDAKIEKAVITMNLIRKK